MKGWPWPLPQNPPAERCTFGDKALPQMRRHIALAGYTVGRAAIRTEYWCEMFTQRLWHFWWGRCILMPYVLASMLLRELRWGWEHRTAPGFLVRQTLGLPRK